jgi:hypothetical protein
MDRVWGQLSLLFSGYRESLRGLMRPESEVDYSFPFRDVVKNEWSCASSPPYGFITWTGTASPFTSYWCEEHSGSWGWVCDWILESCCPQLMAAGDCGLIIRVTLGALAKLRKATINFVISVPPSVCPQGKTRFTLDGCSWIWHLSIFLKSSEKIQV